MITHTFQITGESIYFFYDALKVAVFVYFLYRYRYRVGIKFLRSNI
jgi:hypothetical protein